MQYYTLTNPTAGNPTKVDIFNQMCIDVERLNQQFAVYGAIYYSNSSFSVPANTAGFVVGFAPTGGSPLVYDDQQITDRVNYNKFSVPYGFAYARIILELEFADSGTGKLAYYLLKNGIATFPGNFFKGASEAISEAPYISATPWLPVIPGDVFQCVCDNTDGTNARSAGGSTRCFAMELKK